MSKKCGKCGAPDPPVLFPGSLCLRCFTGGAKTPRLRKSGQPRKKYVRNGGVMWRDTLPREEYKICEHCGGPIVPGPRDFPSTYWKRRTCSRHCHLALLRVIRIGNQNALKG